MLTTWRVAAAVSNLFKTVVAAPFYFVMAERGGMEGWRDSRFISSSFPSMSPPDPIAFADQSAPLPFRSHVVHRVYTRQHVVQKANVRV